jgi:hypothetical protein
MLSVTALPARQGDAIWIRWGDTHAPRHLLIDMGTEEIGEQIRSRILALPEAERVFELLVVTHVDRDHIGGVLTCLAEADPIPGLVIKDVWFNGYPHLTGGGLHTTLKPMGPAQGERFATWLRTQTWNAAFGGGPVQRKPGEPPPSVTMHDRLTLTVLGPTPQRLRELEPVWKDEVEKALHKGTLTTVSPELMPMGPKEPPILEDAEDLRQLAATATPADSSAANGASITLLLRYQDRSVLLTGDAFAEDLVAGIGAANGVGRLQLDVFKLPHHCSQRNVAKGLVAAVDCEYWLVSTDGTQFRHPDPIALARIILHSDRRPPKLAFNVPSKFSGWWDNADWRELYGYETLYGTSEDGLTISFA